MKQVYSHIDADGVMTACEFYIGTHEIQELLKPQITPEGFEIEWMNTEDHGIYVRFKRPDPTSGEQQP